MADVFQCPVYLDPWEKTQLEGVALCVQRIPDTEERTHHGVTCERWHVRFEEDQDLAVRWIDIGDWYLWEPSIRNTSLVHFTRAQLAFTADSQFKHLSIGLVPTHSNPAVPSAAFVCPAAGRIRHFSFHSYVSARVGTPPKPTIYVSRSGVTAHTAVPTNSDTVGVHDYETSTDKTNQPFTKNQFFAVYLHCACTGDDTLTLVNFVVSLRLQWGTFP